MNQWAAIKSFPGAHKFVVKDRGYSNFIAPMPNVPVNPVFNPGDNVWDSIPAPNTQTTQGTSPGTNPIAWQYQGDTPVFPDFTQFGCQDLWALITQYNTTINSPGYENNTPSFKMAYTQAINQASALFDSKKCNVTPIKTILQSINTGAIALIPPDGTDAIAGIGTPGAGTGTATTAPGVAQPAGTATASKKAFPWLIAGAAIVAIFLFSGSSK